MVGNQRVELDENKIITYYNNGMLYTEMAKIENVSESKIQRTITKLKKQGKIGERKNIKYNPNPKINLDMESIICSFKSGVSHKKIANSNGVSEKTIRENIKEWFENHSTIDEYNKIVEANRNAAFTSSRANLPKEELIKMKNNGMSNREIGRHFRVAHSTVAKELERIKEGVYDS